jgi:hypothetical protein
MGRVIIGTLQRPPTRSGEELETITSLNVSERPSTDSNGSLRPAHSRKTAGGTSARIPLTR